MLREVETNKIIRQWSKSKLIAERRTSFQPLIAIFRANTKTCGRFSRRKGRAMTDFVDLLAYFAFQPSLFWLCFTLILIPIVFLFQRRLENKFLSYLDRYAEFWFLSRNFSRMLSFFWCFCLFLVCWLNDCRMKTDVFCLGLSSGGSNQSHCIMLLSPVLISICSSIPWFNFLVMDVFNLFPHFLVSHLHFLLGTMLFIFFAWFLSWYNVSIQFCCG